MSTFDERVRRERPRLNFISSLYNLCKEVNEKLVGGEGELDFVLLALFHHDI
jgi:hypothetical protein